MTKSFLSRQPLTTAAKTHSLTHALPHSVTDTNHSLTLTFTHSLAHLLTHSLTHSLAHSFTHSVTHWVHSGSKTYRIVILRYLVTTALLSSGSRYTSSSPFRPHATYSLTRSLSHSFAH